MHITRIFSDVEGDSFFEDIEIKLENTGEIGNLSTNYPVENIIFRETSGDYDFDFHNAPHKQFIVLLDGVIEIETSLGVKRRFKKGEILLAEDTSGKGHKSKSIDGKLRRSLFITLKDNDVKIR